VKWKALIVFCGKFIQDTTLLVLSESCKFYGRYENTISAYFFIGTHYWILKGFTTFIFNKVAYKCYTGKLGTITIVWL